MVSESHAAQGLKDFVHWIGIPAQVHTDNAKVETLSEWKDFIGKHWIKAMVTEQYTPNQNKCEHEFGCVRIHAHMLMEQNAQNSYGIMSSTMSAMCGTGWLGKSLVILRP